MLSPTEQSSDHLETLMKIIGVAEKTLASMPGSRHGSPEDEDESMLGIPEIWYWLAIGCKDCDVNQDVTASPVVLALWAVAFKKNKRQIYITEGFREDWKLDRRSTDRVLKRLHKKALLVYSINNKRDNCVTLLATPCVDE